MPSLVAQAGVSYVPCVTTTEAQLGGRKGGTLESQFSAMTSTLEGGPDATPESAVTLVSSTPLEASTACTT